MATVNCVTPSDKWVRLTAMSPTVLRGSGHTDHGTQRADAVSQTLFAVRKCRRLAAPLSFDADRAGNAGKRGTDQ
jgi:hypothetical protein